MTDITVIGAGGEYMESVVVVEWHKKLGDVVKAGELVVTVETAKAATEIESPVDGILSEIRAEVGDEIPVGAVLGTVDDGIARPTTMSTDKDDNKAAQSDAQSGVKQAAGAAVGKRVVASPLARRVASQRQIDLTKVTASSRSGRIRLRDLDAYVETAAQPSGGEPPPLPEAPLPVQSATTFASASGTGPSLNIVTRGKVGGERVVLLHGFGSDSLSWQPLLAAMGGGYHFSLVDLPSHGRSPQFEGGPTVHQMAESVFDTLTAAGIDDFHLVGHSLGGAVSLALAARARLSIRSLTLLAPAGLGPEIDGSFILGFARAAQAESLTPWLNKLFANPSFLSPAFVSATIQARSDAQLRDAQLRLAQAVFPDSTQAVGLRDVVRDSLFPQKIIWGDQDRIIPMQHANGTGGSVGVHILPGVGHLPHVEAPAIVARLLAQNIRSAPI